MARAAVLSFLLNRLVQFVTSERDGQAESESESESVPLVALHKPAHVRTKTLLWFYNVLRREVAEPATATLFPVLCWRGGPTLQVTDRGEDGFGLWAGDRVKGKEGAVAGSDEAIRPSRTGAPCIHPPAFSSVSSWFRRLATSCHFPMFLCPLYSLPTAASSVLVALPQSVGLCGGAQSILIVELGLIPTHDNAVDDAAWASWSAAKSLDKRGKDETGLQATSTLDPHSSAVPWDVWRMKQRRQQLEQSVVVRRYNGYVCADELEGGARDDEGVYFVSTTQRASPLRHHNKQEKKKDEDTHEVGRGCRGHSLTRPSLVAREQTHCVLRLHVNLPLLHGGRSGQRVVSELVRDVWLDGWHVVGAPLDLSCTASLDAEAASVAASSPSLHASTCNASSFRSSQQTTELLDEDESSDTEAFMSGMWCHVLRVEVGGDTGRTVVEFRKAEAKSRGDDDV